MKKINFLFLLLIFSISSLKAQFSFIGSFEGGFAGSTVKTDELPVFLNAYNTYNASGLQKSFDMKPGMARGRYFNFVVGMGGAKCKAIVGFGQYLVRTPFNEAKFTNGEGRNIQVELKDASTTTGVRFDLGRFTTSILFDMIIRNVSIYSQYEFQDGSKSYAADHSLNGVFSNSRLQVGFGGNFGYRIIPHVFLLANFEYVMQTDKSHPEYHQYEDLQQFKVDGPDFLPRDMVQYTTNSWDSGNSISNDVRGLRFGLGIQVTIGNSNDE